MDLNADKRPDLVETGNPDFSYQSFGGDGGWFWKVYLNLP